MTDAFVTVPERRARGRARPIRSDAGEGPDGIAAQLGRARLAERRLERRHGYAAQLPKLADGAGAHRGPPVVEELHEVGGLEALPLELEAARVVHSGRAFPAHAVNASEHVGLGELRRRAAELVPAARVDDDQAA